MMMTYPGEAGDGAAARSSRQRGEDPQRPDDRARIDQMSDEQVRAELEVLREREAQIIELLRARSPEKILHDLRNLLNEVQLLRVLADQEKA